MVSLQINEADMFKLSDDDGRAVDMLLDSAASSNGNGHGGHVRAAPARIRERLENVESILNLLKQMPKTEPPKNLLAKTMATIERRGSKRARKFSVAQSDQPHHRRPNA